VAVAVWVVEFYEVVEALLGVGFAAGLAEDLIGRWVFLVRGEFRGP